MAASTELETHVLNSGRVDHHELSTHCSSARRVTVPKLNHPPQGLEVNVFKELAVPALDDMQRLVTVIADDAVSAYKGRVEAFAASVGCWLLPACAIPARACVPLVSEKFVHEAVRPVVQEALVRARRRLQNLSTAKRMR